MKASLKSLNHGIAGVLDLYMIKAFTYNCDMLW